MENLKNIKLLALDVDGVLTDGSIVIGNTGELCKKFNAQDGLGISAAIRHGFKVVFITGRHSEILLRRAKELGVEKVLENIKDKKSALLELCKAENIDISEAAFMGDDLNDLSPLLAAGASFAPCTACEDVKTKVMYVTKKMAGYGAVREVIELILKEQGLWEKIVEDYCVEGQGDKQ